MINPVISSSIICGNTTFHFYEICVPDFRVGKYSCMENDLVVFGSRTLASSRYTVTNSWTRAAAPNENYC